VYRVQYVKRNDGKGHTWYDHRYFLVASVDTFKAAKLAAETDFGDWLADASDAEEVKTFSTNDWM
ncbi:MAG: hypothetical protein ABIH03_06820, partial [Pseudomonadota bacterium]